MSQAAYPKGFRNKQAMTEGATYLPGDAVKIRASVAGTVTLVLDGGATETIDVDVGTSIWPYAATRWAAGTATATEVASLGY